MTFLANNSPVANALLKYKGEFEQPTGMTLKVDSYQEQQMRQRPVTVMNSRSDEVDVFMSLQGVGGECAAVQGLGRPGAGAQGMGGRDQRAEQD